MSHSIDPSDLPDRGEFSEIAVIIEFGTLQLKIYDVKNNRETFIPPVLLERDKRIYGEQAVNIAQRRGAKLCNPIKGDGFIDSFENLVKLFKAIFEEELDEAAVLVVESTPGQGDLELHRSQRKELAKHLIEDFDIDAYFVAPQPLLAMCYLERNLNFRQRNGTIIDIGHSQTRVSIIYRGSILTKCCFHSDIAGYNFEELLLKEIAFRHHHSSLQIKNILREIKEKYLLVLPRGKVTKQYLQKFDLSPEFGQKYRKEVALNLNQSISIDKERFTIPEVLFKPSILTGAFSEEDSLSGLFLQSKQRFEKFCQKMIDRNNPDFDSPEEMNRLLKKIYIVGGCSRIEGMVERVKEEIEHLFIMEWIERNQLDVEESYEEVREGLGIQFYHKLDPLERGKESLLGGIDFVETSENRDWIYTISLEKELDLVVEKCPK